MVHGKRAIGLVTFTAIVLLGAGFMAFLWGPFRAGAGEDGGSPVPASEVQRLGGDAEQQAALADLKVTNAEYVSAVYATVACIRAEGVAVSDPSPSADGKKLVYTGGPFPTYDDLRRAKPVLQSCYEAHLRGIDVVTAN